MTMISEKYVGIDVSKDKLDVAIWGEKKKTHFTELYDGCAAMTRR